MRGNSYILIPTVEDVVTDGLVQLFKDLSVNSEVILRNVNTPISKFNVVLPYIGKAPIPANATRAEIVTQHCYFLKNNNAGAQHSVDTLGFFESDDYLSYYDIGESDYNNQLVVFTYLPQETVTVRIIY